MVNGLQIKMARIALGWDAATLADASEVALTTLSRIENGGGSYASTLAKLQATLEAGGVVFIADRQNSPDGGPGVRLALNVSAAKVPAKARAKPAGSGRGKPAMRKGRGK